MSSPAYTHPKTKPKPKTSHHPFFRPHNLKKRKKILLVQEYSVMA